MPLTIWAGMWCWFLSLADHFWSNAILFFLQMCLNTKWKYIHLKALDLLSTNLLLVFCVWWITSGLATILVFNYRIYNDQALKSSAEPRISAELTIWSRWNSRCQHFRKLLVANCQLWRSAESWAACREWLDFKVFGQSYCARRPQNKN